MKDCRVIKEACLGGVMSSLQAKDCFPNSREVESVFDFSHVLRSLPPGAETSNSLVLEYGLLFALE
jgi:hypothetical protein